MLARRGRGLPASRGSTSCARRASSSGSAPTADASRCCTATRRRSSGRPPARRPHRTGAAHDALRGSLASGPRFLGELVIDDGPAPRGADRRAVGSGLGGRGHERRVRAAARPAQRAGSPPRGTRRRAAGSRAAAARPPEPRSGAGPPTAALYAHPADPAERARAIAELLLERHGVLTRRAVAGEQVPGGFSGGLSRALRPRDARRLPPRLVRRRARRRAVRPAGRDRAAARRARGAARPDATWCSPRPTRPTCTARRCPGRGAPQAVPRAPPGPTSCCATASPSCTSSGAAARSSRCPTAPARTSGPRSRRSPTRSGAGVPRRLTIERLDGESVLESPALPAFLAAGFEAGPRRLVLRAPRA